jgi:hypothetical protein
VTWQPQVSSTATEDERWRFCLSRSKLGFRLATASQVQHFATLLLFHSKGLGQLSPLKCNTLQAYSCFMLSSLFSSMHLVFASRSHSKDLGQPSPLKLNTLQACSCFLLFSLFSFVHLIFASRSHS